MDASYLSVTLHPRAPKEMLVSLGAGRFEAWVKAKPIDGAANEALRHLLARSLRVPPEQLRLIKGHSGRHKVFKIQG